MMRIVVLRTSGSNCAAIHEPLSGLGHEVYPVFYDIMSLDDYRSLPAMISAIQPNWVLMFGTCIAEGSPPIPSIDILAAIGKKYPFVHMCFDGAESAWWPQLIDYQERGIFELFINIDGVNAEPISKFSVTALTPLDANSYPNPPIPWISRNIKLGFCGGWGGPQPRTYAIQDLVTDGLLTVRDRDVVGDGFDEYKAFMCRCRCIWNHALTGTGDRMHVKGRVIEAALAGAVLFETKGSPTSNWFDPGVDYFECADRSEVRSNLEWVDSHPDEAQTMANNLRRKFIERHSAQVFWKAVGMGL